MVKEKLCIYVVKIRRVGGRVMAVVLVFEEDMLRLICGYLWLCAWVTLMDAWVGILMDLMRFMDIIVYVRGIWKEEP